MRNRTATSFPLGRSSDNCHEHWDFLQPQANGRCAILPPIAGKQAGRAVSPYTEDTGSVPDSSKPRRGAGSAPKKEEF